MLYAVILGIIFVFYTKKDALLKALGMQGGTSGDGQADAENDQEKPELAALYHGYGPSVAQAAQAAAAGQVEPLLGVMKQARAGAWEFRYKLMEAGAALPSYTWQTRVTADPQSTEPLLMLASRLVSEGWKARGHGAGSTVSEKASNVFEAKIAQAEEILVRVASMDPEDPTPHARLVSYASYTSEDEAVARRRLSEALRRAPDHFGAILNMTHYIAPHWHGSKEKALAFGREMVAGASEGSLRAGTIITSYVTIWHYMHWFEKGANKDKIRAMLADPAVQAEIRNAYQRSVASPKHQLSAWSYHLLNQAAGIFYCIQDRAATAEALARIGDRKMDNPWEYLGTPAKVFAQARKWASQS